MKWTLPSLLAALLGLVPLAAEAQVNGVVNGSGGISIVTDGTTTTRSANTIDFTAGCAVTASGGIAQIACSGSGGSVIGPGTTVIGYVPQWSNITGTGLGAGLPVATAATASTIVERDASANITANGATLSGLNLIPGTAPTSPNNGDLWTTSTVVGVQIGGVTYNLLAPAVGSIGGLGTGVATALGVNTGSAGSFLVQGSGTVPNASVAAAPLPTPGAGATLVAPRSYYICTTTCSITLPVPAAGDEFCVMNDDNVSTVITFLGIGSSASYEKQAMTSYGTAGTGTFVSGGAVGDRVCFLGRDSTHYNLLSIAGTWTAS